MRLSGGLGHLSYCTNIHPGEQWPQVWEALRTHLLEVRERVAPGRRFGIGLRLSDLAARQLEQPEVLRAFADWLQEHDLYVFTINGFVYGPFHGEPVKQRVYQPHWGHAERLQYTNRLARLLAQLLPPDVEGSVSSAPLGFAQDAAARQALPDMADQLLAHAAQLVRLERQTGRRIALALEPEPCCLLETTEQACEFFRQHLHSERAAATLGRAVGLERGQAARALRQHLGVCLDTCHQAVEFEAPDACLDALSAAGIRIAKLQLSSGLELQDSETARARLAAFEDGVYLHQVVVRTADGRLWRHTDLAAARERPVDPTSRWRVHFHVPIFQRELGAFASTQPFLRRILERQRLAAVTGHLEVETYTWTVLPPELRLARVSDSIAREIQWVEEILEAPAEE